ncbi:hypothetical protein RQP46_002717 [Phenoliferia psychrophenolica]
MTKTVSSAASFFDLKAETPKGTQYEFKQLEGKVTLILNVASKCGFTPQYKGLQALHEKYGSKGLQIIGFPSNQFGGQEPGTDEEIGATCQLNHGVTFPLMKKSDVNGDHENEVYKWLKSKKSGLLGMSRIKWNFEKFLVDQKGNVVKRYSSLATPEKIDADIAALLAGSEVAPASPTEPEAEAAGAKVDA